MAEPTTEELSLISEFRENVKDVLVTPEQEEDHNLIRWLRARDLDLHKAEAMIRTSHQWRKDLDIDNVLERWLDPWFMDMFPLWTDSTDKAGRPIVEIPIGQWDLRVAVARGREDEFFVHICKMFESAMKRFREDAVRAKEAGTWPNAQFTAIVDWNGYSYSQLMHWRALQNILKVATTYETHYPEICAQVFFINCPSIFPLFMAIFKGVIAPRTLNKIRCFSNSKDWWPALREQIDENQLHRLVKGNTYETNNKNDLVT